MNRKQINTGKKKNLYYHWFNSRWIFLFWAC